MLQIIRGAVPVKTALLRVLSELESQAHSQAERRGMPSFAAWGPGEQALSTSWRKRWLKRPVPDRSAKAAEAFAGRWFRNSARPGLLVITGADQRAASTIARALWDFSRAASVLAYEKRNWAVLPTAHWIRWRDLAEQCCAPGYEIPDETFKSGLVILEGVGAEQGVSQDELNRLAQCLARREQMFSVVTTPVSQQAWAEVFDERIAFRLSLNSVVVEVSQDDASGVHTGRNCQRRSRAIGPLGTCNDHCTISLAS